VQQFNGAILALDVATHTGVCDGVAGCTPRLSTINWRHAKTDDVTAIYSRAVGWMATRLKDDPPALVVIERPVPPSAAWGNTNHQTTLITIGLFGVFCGIAACKGIEVLEAPISSWRKFALGSGKLKGSIAKQRAVELCQHLGWPAEDHNAAESAGIWLWACATRAPHLVHRPEPLFARVAS
jgi:hypothetical protein